MPAQVQAASGLPQIQQHTDPNNHPDPQDDELPAGVAFPLGDNEPSSPFGQQWSTGPDGPQPRTAAASMDEGMAEALAHADVGNGKVKHQGQFPGNSQQHGKYMREWNNLAGLMHGLTGRAALSKQDYGKQTGRPDLHNDYLASYAQGYKQGKTTMPRADDGGQVTAALRVIADAWSEPRRTTDDFSPPYNTPQTAPDPFSSNGSPEAQDYSAGLSAGQSDRQAGERPMFADNSTGVSPYVKGYAQGYGASREPSGPQDVPRSMGGDSGQGQNAQEAQRSFQVARASLRTSAAFAPDALMRDPDFRKGYLFASKWQPGQRLAATGSARFEAGMYAGVTDRPAVQAAWIAEHWTRAPEHPELGRRIGLHQSFTRKAERRRGLRTSTAYLRAQAGTSTDLITDGPGTSPDPMGATPLNGPGTPPPMGGLSQPAAPGGAPPYQGAAPLPGGPVVPDDVMGPPQQPAQPDGPFTTTFSGNHPENAGLAPVAPNKADQAGYSNAQAYQGSPRGADRLAAFRNVVQANLATRGAR